MSTSSNFDAMVKEGVHLAELGEAGISKRDAYAKTYLTAAGQTIYAEARPGMGSKMLEEQVKLAVSAGY